MVFKIVDSGTIQHHLEQPISQDLKGLQLRVPLLFSHRHASPIQLFVTNLTSSLRQFLRRVRGSEHVQLARSRAPWKALLPRSPTRRWLRRDIGGGEGSTPHLEASFSLMPSIWAFGTLGCYTPMLQTHCLLVHAAPHQCARVLSTDVALSPISSSVQLRSSRTLDPQDLRSHQLQEITASPVGAKRNHKGDTSERELSSSFLQLCCEHATSRRLLSHNKQNTAQHKCEDTQRCGCRQPDPNRMQHQKDTRSRNSTLQACRARSKQLLLL